MNIKISSLCALLLVLVLAIGSETALAKSYFLTTVADATYQDGWKGSGDLYVKADHNRISAKSYIEFRLDQLPQQNCKDATIFLYIKDRSSMDRLGAVSYSPNVWYDLRTMWPTSEVNSYVVKRQSSLPLSSDKWLRVNAKSLVNECINKNVQFVTICLKPTDTSKTGFVKIASKDDGEYYAPELVVDY